MAATNARDFGNVRKLPSGRYQARYRGPDGVRYPAPTTFTTKKAANAWLSDVQSDIERGRWKSPEQLAADDALTAALRAEVLTVAELANVWMETIPSDNHRTLSASRVRRFINPELGDIKIDELSRERCEQWYRDMNETLCPGAPTQVRRTFAALHAMLKLAVHKDWIATSPLRIKGALIDVPAREPQTATPAEVDQLAAAMPEELGMAVQIAAWCTLRAGEVLGLQIDDIAVDRHTAVPLAPTVRLNLRRHIVAGRGTGSMQIVGGTKESEGRPESIVVPPHLVAPLWGHVRKYGRKTDPRWLFPGTRSVDLPCGPATLDRRWRLAREACGMEQLTFHDLRRTGNTIAARAGATLGEMKQRLRHRSSTAAERYIVAARGEDVALAARMSQQAVNPHRVAPGVEVVRAGMDVVGAHEIDTAIDNLRNLVERVLDAGNEVLERYLLDQLDEVSTAAGTELRRRSC
ncbi:tyrosine-type recombinase/integrase [Mycobacteroides abscessus]|uniref:tyrosine-type recombinase/integrase n=1 Tax=Mycobacteroides abscessus TaxID=36809 RepID=UPI00092900B1|nr:site-specific integrase [Mycobacteroides abscessus]MDO3312479.1 site-specific integrase [Mycobacteroides abscessus subsp. abscessus]MDO3344839.1 site-specific integrase [Mycobacteroides abscessus subsp. abscessus]QOF39538.1 hypothetical protein E3G66_003742 [Mycobacteroides abscessus]SHP06574.1 Integrase [Mycobacteroides abscessus subsp. abscessus]SHP21060.1 Integrase [Mycobacteroides abscessus subsp. abscessus]